MKRFRIAAALLPLTFVACSIDSDSGPLAVAAVVCADCDAGDRVDFGTVLLGSTAQRQILLRNEGSAPAHIAPLDALPGGFGSSLVCAGGGCGDHMIAPGGTLAVTLSYAASAVGPAAATIDLQPDGPALQLAAVGAAAPARIGPELLNTTNGDGCVDVGFVAPGGSKEFELYIGNSGADAIALGQIALPGTSAFALGTPVPERIAGGGSATVVLTFVPSAVGLEEATLEIGTRDPATPGLEVCLVGKAGGARLTCSPDPLDFGSAYPGFPLTQPITCTNDGWDVPGVDGETLVIETIATDSAAYTAAVREGRTNYALGESFTLDVTFSPGESGPAAASLAIRSNDVERGLRSVALTADVLPQCDFDIQPPNLRFGYASGPQTHAFAVQNRRDTACLLANFRLEGNHVQPFSIELHEGPYVLPGSGELVVPVRYDAPAGEGVYDAVVRFDVSHATSRTQEVSLRGAAGGCLVAVPGTVDFGASVRPGCNGVERTVEIYNRCFDPVSIADIALNASATPAFGIGSIPVLPAQLRAGESMRLAVSTVHAGPDPAYGMLFVFADPEHDGLLDEEPLGIPLTVGGASDPRVSEHFSVGGAKTDILLVLDNAPGGESLLASEPEMLLAGLGGDWQLGVTTAGLDAVGGCPGGADGGENGRLFPVDGSSARIVSSSLPQFERYDALAAIADVGTCQTSGSPLQAAVRALTPPLVDSADDPRTAIADDGNLGLLRDDAQLEVVLYANHADTLAAETTDAHVGLLRLLKNDPGKVRIHTVSGGDAAGSCTPAGDARFAQAAAATGGAQIAWCDADRNAQLGEALFLPRACYPLGSKPADTDADGDLGEEIRVFQNEIELAQINTWSYDASTNALCFDAPGMLVRGAALRVEYTRPCVAPAP